MIFIDYTIDFTERENRKGGIKMDKDLLKLVKRIKKTNDEFAELYKKGVTAIGYTNKEVQVDTELFKKLAQGKYTIEFTKESAYPYRLHIEVSGVKFFTLLTQEEFKNLKEE